MHSAPLEASDSRYQEAEGVRPAENVCAYAFLFKLLLRWSRDGGDSDDEVVAPLVWAPPSLPA